MAQVDPGTFLVYPSSYHQGGYYWSSLVLFPTLTIFVNFLCEYVYCTYVCLYNKYIMYIRITQT